MREDNNKAMTEDKNKRLESIYGDDTIIMIEKVEKKPEKAEKEVVMPPAQKRRHVAAWSIAAIIVALLIVIIVLLLSGIFKAKEEEVPSAPLPVSNTAEKNTEILQEKAAPTQKPAVTLTSDTINDVCFRLYAIRGLCAELSFQTPDFEDESVYFCTQSADVRADNGNVMCECVMAGEQISRGNSRSGYFAAVGDNMVIGVANNDSVMEYARNNGGHFFRQFAIVSDGQLGDVRLKGKAPRSALGTKDGQLYYVQSLNRESLYDFAEALCDYGFTDALYIPSDGKEKSYRDSTGTWHQGEDISHDVLKADTTLQIPQLIFKATKK